MDSNWWVLKPDFRLPTEEEIRAMVSPEQCCAYYSMLVAEQRLKVMVFSLQLNKWSGRPKLAPQYFFFFPSRTQDTVRNLFSHQKRRTKRTFKWKLMMRYLSYFYLITNIRITKCFPNWQHTYFVAHSRCGQLLGTRREPLFQPWRGNACWRLQVLPTRQAVEKVSPTWKCPTSLLSRRSDHLNQKSSNPRSILLLAQWNFWSCLDFQDDKEPQPVKKTVTGTDADLRRLSLKNAKQLLRKFGVPEEEVKL